MRRKLDAANCLVRIRKLMGKVTVAILATLATGSWRTTATRECALARHASIQIFIKTQLALRVQ